MNCKRSVDLLISFSRVAISVGLLIEMKNDSQPSGFPFNL